MDWFWSTAQGCGRLIGSIARFDTKSSIGISVASFLLVFVSETELSKILDQKYTNWATICLIAVFLVFLTMLSAKNGTRWWNQLQSLSNGVAIEVPVMSQNVPLIFSNTGTRGPLEGEVLHYELRVQLTALRNLRGLRASVIALGRQGRHQPTQELHFPDFGGSVSKGHTNTVSLATLEIEHRGMTSGGDMTPHSKTSPIRVRLLNNLAFEEIGAGSMHEFVVTARHASGANTARLLLWTSTGVPLPGTIRIIEGQVSLKQISLT